MDHQEMGMYQTFVDKVPKNNPKRIKWRQIHGQLNEVCFFSTLFVELMCYTRVSVHSD